MKETDERCLVCGTDLMSENPNLCKNFHNQTKAREILDMQLAEIKQRDDSIRRNERDKLYKRLQNLTITFHCETVIPWEDINCLFAELKDEEQL